MKETEKRRFCVRGLEGQVEVRIDRWGVPHIYADSAADMFCAQGFVAAYNRLFQMDLWRRWGLGRLAEVFGEEYAESDRATRLFVYRGDMRAEWLAYGSGVKSIAESFTSGINAFVDAATTDHPELLPHEFELLDYRPALWEPEDIARIRVNGLHYNLESEVARARLVSRYGAALDDLRFVREPGGPIADELEKSVVEAMQDDVLRVYRLAMTPPPTRQPGAVGKAKVADSKHGSGSNNWVVSGSRTETRRPILANDPHRGLAVPSLRFVTHLVSPECNVIGAGEPGIPGVSIGHNERVAFGLTIIPIDQEDLYVYRISAEHPGAYLYRGAWEAFETREEVVEIRDCAPQLVTLKFTRHGPVIYESIERGVACCARVAWLEPGMAPYLGSVHYMNTQSAQEFADAMDRWGAPGENQVYADIDGHIGYKPGGVIPRRTTWTGLLPVAGDGRHEWAGFVEPGVIEGERNPQRGWSATANQRTVRWREWEAAERFCYEWYPGFRFRRIAEVLANVAKVSVGDCVGLQLDVKCLPALELIHGIELVVDEAALESADAQWAWRELRCWDGEMGRDSLPAALFEAWHRLFLRPALLRRAVQGLVPPSEVEEVVASLIPDESLSGDSRVDLMLVAEAGEDRLKLLGTLEETLRETVDYLERRLGADRDSWRWGRLHVARPEHAVEALAGGDTSAWKLPAVERSGNGETVHATASGPDFCQSAGASFRMVLDVGAWDSSVFVNAPGQSGRPDDQHYADHWVSWADGKYFPLVYSRAAVEEATETCLVLEREGVD